MEKLYRDHKGGFSESMSTSISINCKDDIINHLRKSLEVIDIRIDYYGFDNRNNWETYIVMCQIKDHQCFYPVGWTNNSLSDDNIISEVEHHILDGVIVTTNQFQYFKPNPTKTIHIPTGIMNSKGITSSPHMNTNLISVEKDVEIEKNMKLSDLQIFSNKTISDFTKQVFDEDYFFYHYPYGDKGGFEFICFQKSDPNHEDIEMIVNGWAAFDGIRHLHFGDEKSDNYGYFNYPKMSVLIQIMTKLRDLELLHCGSI